MTENLPKQRSGTLTLWLTLGLLVNIAFAFSYLNYFVGFSAIAFFTLSFFTGYPALYSIPLLTVYSLVSVCSVLALFKFRKWGFYTLILSTAAELATHAVTGILAAGSIIDIAFVVILFMLLRPQWNLFR
jgi:hypothetical protein